MYYCNLLFFYIFIVIFVNLSSPNLFTTTTLSTVDKNEVLNIESINSILPYCMSGPIVKGFRRGTTDLNHPTANYPNDIVNALPKEISNGVYFGWANVNNDNVNKAVISIGYNPFYKNINRTMETHILHSYNKDLYGKILKVCICGYLRMQENFDDIESLKKAIIDDSEQAKLMLDQSKYLQYAKHDHFFADI